MPDRGDDTLMLDLEKHVRERVRAAMLDVAALVDHPSDKGSIAFMAAVEMVGYSAGFFAAAGKARGVELTQRQAFDAVVTLLRKSARQIAKTERPSP